MSAQGPAKHICTGCGAKLAANLRYCIYCYRPVTESRSSRAHIESARVIDTTHRDDPTTVFLPEEHEAIKRRARRRKRLLITGAIVFVLAVAVSVTFYYLNRHWRESEKATAREQMARRELRLLSDGLERFKMDIGRYPTTEEGVGSLTRKPSLKGLTGGGQWFGPYLDGVYEVDPWGNDYVYEATDAGQGFTLFSSGPAGETGSGSQFQVTSVPDTGN
ncbi:MAG: type II secretion system protein GspG [Blastocatellia bacterium]